MRLWPPRLQPWPQNDFGPPNIGPLRLQTPTRQQTPQHCPHPLLVGGGCCRLNQPATAPPTKNFKVHGGLLSVDLVDNSPPPFLMGGLLSVNLADNSPPLYVVLHHRTWQGQIIFLLICTFDPDHRMLGWDGSHRLVDAVAGRMNDP
jgi:hypothetical protein